MESLKSLLLLVLVGLSLYLSGLLYTGGPDPAQAVPPELREPVAAGEPVDRVALFAPERFVLHVNGQHYLLYPGTGTYQNLWRMVGKALSESRPSDRTVMEPAGDRYLEVTMPVSMPLSLWPVILGGRALEMPGQADSFVFSLDQPRLRAVGGSKAGSELVYPVNLIASYLNQFLPDRPSAGEVDPSAEGGKGGPDGFDDSALREIGFIPAVELSSQGVDTNGNIFVPAGGLTVSPVRLVSEEERTPDEIAGEFLVDPSVARKIIEGDGATIFTDGTRGVRIYPSGAYEFTRSAGNSKDPLPLDRALDAALQYGEAHGGWPEGAVLAGVRPADSRPLDQDWSESTSFWFGFTLSHDGLKAEGEFLQSEVIVDSSGVVYFGRTGRIRLEPAGEGRPIVPAAESLKRAGIGGRVLEMRLGYHGLKRTEAQEVLSPVWTVVTPAGEVYIDAYSGGLLELGNGG